MVVHINPVRSDRWWASPCNPPPFGAGAVRPRLAFHAGEIDRSPATANITTSDICSGSGTNVTNVEDRGHVSFPLELGNVTALSASSPWRRGLGSSRFPASPHANARIKMILTAIDALPSLPVSAFASSFRALGEHALG